MAFIDTNTYILAEGRNFKKFLKENDAVALHIYYMFTKKMLNLEINMMLIVLMYYAYISDSWTLQQLS